MTLSVKIASGVIANSLSAWLMFDQNSAILDGDHSSGRKDDARMQSRELPVLLSDASQEAS